MKLNYKIVGAVAVVAIIGMVAAKKQGWIGGSGDAIEVEVGYAHKRTVIETVTASGKIQPEVEVKMSPEVSGEIIEVNVVEGQQVAEGDVLVRINADIYESAITRARAAVNSAKSSLAQSRAALVEAEKLWKRNKEPFLSKNLMQPSVQFLLLNCKRKPRVISSKVRRLILMRPIKI
jgi:HlyD family secretion protein